MRVYILGICGTFMGGVARLARELGHQVGGADTGVYPPMSTQLADLGVDLHAGYEPQRLQRWHPDLVVIGNALSRGNALVEAVLNDGIPYISGPQWVAENVLRERRVLAVAGTHGKTTTASLLCWLLEHGGLAPGFLIGGVPENFGVSARLGRSQHFVIEADEYDTAFFDKRSKFVHYRPTTLVLNNLEYDHADIFEDIGDIKKQFHHLVRTVPGNGLILVNQDDRNLDQVLNMGCWSVRRGFSVHGIAEWTAHGKSGDFSRFEVHGAGERHAVVSPLIGAFNMSNALAAIAAAHDAGVPLDEACAGVASFKSVKRRLQLLATINGVRVYDDFAHHPTAILATLEAVRSRAGDGRVVCVLEPRSNTMLMGRHGEDLRRSLSGADRTFVFKPEKAVWNVEALASESLIVSGSVADMVRMLSNWLQSGDHVVIMSNGSFDNIHEKLIDALNVSSLKASGRSAS